MDRKEILDEVATDMRELYKVLRSRQIEKAEADTLANVAGKTLKAVQLHIADDYLLEEQRKRLPVDYSVGLPERAAS